MSKKQSSSKKSKAVYVTKLAQSLPSQAKDAVAYICEAFVTWREQQVDNVEEIYAEYMGFFALLNMYLDGLHLGLAVPDLSGDKQQDIQLITGFFSSVRHQLAQMTLDLSLLANLNKSLPDSGDVRFHKLAPQEKQSVSDISDQLHAWLSGTPISDAAAALLAEKYAIIHEQVLHDVLDLDLAWRYVSQYSVTLDALELDKKIPTDLLQQISAVICRIQASAEKLPDSSLKTILMKLTNPTRWEQESAASRREV